MKLSHAKHFGCLSVNKKPPTRIVGSKKELGGVNDRASNPRKNVWRGFYSHKRSYEEYHTQWFYSRIAAAQADASKSAMMKRTRKNFLSFVKDILIKDSVKDTLWTTIVLYRVIEIGQWSEP